MSDNKNDGSVGEFETNIKGLVRFMMGQLENQESWTFEQRKEQLLRFVKTAEEKHGIGVATIKRIHVNQHNIRANKKAGNQDLPVYTIKNRGGVLTATRVDVLGSSQLVYTPDDPLSCGAHCWVESTSDIVYEDENKNIVWVR